MVIDGHNDLVLQRWRGEPGRHIDLETARRGWVRRRVLRAVRPVAVRRRSAGDAVRHAVCRRRFRSTRPRGSPRSSSTRCVRCRSARASVGRRLPRRRGHGDRAHGGRRGDRRRTCRTCRTGTTRGLRSIGIVWSRPNAFAEGVPFQFPASPDTGPGLTDAGRALVRACNELGILVDVSHLNERGFWDVAEISDAADRRDALERTRAVRVDAEPDGRAARRGARLGRRRRRQLRRHLPARGRDERLRGDRARRDRPSRRLPRRPHGDRPRRIRLRLRRRRRPGGARRRVGAAATRRRAARAVRRRARSTRSPTGTGCGCSTPPGARSLRFGGCARARSGRSRFPSSGSAATTSAAGSTRRRRSR